MDKIVSLCKRRGFVFQSSEIYGGAASVWDYGPLGVELRRNIADAWWSDLVHARDDIEGLDAGILMHSKVWRHRGISPASPTRSSSAKSASAVGGRTSSSRQAARASRP